MPPLPSDNLEELRRRRDSAQKSLELAGSGLRKCKQKGGAAAHKRGWYFEEQIEKWQLVIDRLDVEIETAESEQGPSGDRAEGQG